MKKILVAFVFVLALVGVSGLLTRHFQSKNTFTTIRVADPRAVGGALFHVALEKGFFEEQGLRVEVLGVQTGDEALRAVVGDSVDVALGGLIPYSFLALDNQRVKLFAINAYVSDSQVIANASKGIKTAEDLRGKKIGYTKTTASDIGVRQFLSVHQLQPSDVELVNMKPLAMPGALQAGQIDAYASWEPHILNGQKLLGSSAFVFSGDQDVYTWHQGLMSKDEYIREHQADLVKFVRALQKAEVFVKTNQTESITLAAKHNAIPVDTLTKIWPRYDLSVGLRDDVSTILSTDLAWANAQREKPVTPVPLPQVLIDTSVLHDVQD